MLRSVACLLIQSILCLYCFAQDKIISIPILEDSALHLTAIPAIKDNKIRLQWHTVDKDAFYIIERSPDQKTFDVIGVMKAKGLDSNCEFVDEKPLAKRNYYRIKMQVADERNYYSDITTAGVTDSIFCKFYPNPVDKLLILRSDYHAGLKITDFTGKARIMQQIKPGLQVLDVSCLEKSIYVITIYHEETNQVITKKLIKN